MNHNQCATTYFNFNFNTLRLMSDDGWSFVNLSGNPGMRDASIKKTVRSHVM